MPASRPMITTTIMISIRENAERRGARGEGRAEAMHARILAPCPLPLAPAHSLNRITSLQNRQHRRQNDEQHDDGEHHDDQRLKDRGKSLRGRLHLLIIAYGQSIEHFFQPAGLLTYREDL